MDVRIFLKLPIVSSKSLLKLLVVSGIAGKYIYNYADKAPFAQASQNNC